MSRLESDLFNYKTKSEYSNGVLKNKLNIHDQKELDIIERDLTNLKLSRLYLNPEESLIGTDKNNIVTKFRKFSADHYLNIHKFLFDEIYYFAGEIRSDNMQKRISFCNPLYIYNNLKYNLEKADQVSKKIKNRDDLLDFLVYFYPEFDVIHPFREGNGRCQREFFRQYVLDICKKNNLDNYYLDFSRISDKDYFIDTIIKADIGMDTNNELRDIFDEILVSPKKLTR